MPTGSREIHPAELERERDVAGALRQLLMDGMRREQALAADLAASRRALAECDRLRETVTELNHLLRMTLASTSWRLSSPIRVAGILAQKVLRRGWALGSEPRLALQAAVPDAASDIDLPRSAALALRRMRIDLPRGRAGIGERS